MKDITGEITAPWGLYGSDLGIVRRDPDRGHKLAVMFGDSFSQPKLQGDWVSPTILMYNDVFEPLGVPATGHEGQPVIDTAGKVRQLWPYEHRNPVFSTVLPTDFIRVGEWWYVHVMVMGPHGLKDGAVWTEWQRSRDLVNWEWLSKSQPPTKYATMLTFDQNQDWVYIFGTHGLSRDGDIRLWRCEADRFPATWTSWWGWTGIDWGMAHHANPILKGQYGELCYRTSQHGDILSYFDAAQYRVAARVSIDGPNGMGRGRGNRETVIAEGVDLPQLYGGYLSPTSDLANGKAQFIISQWRTADNSVYKASVHDAKLAWPKKSRFPGLLV